jgi:hypothetical protein
LSALFNGQHTLPKLKPLFGALRLEPRLQVVHESVVGRGEAGPQLLDEGLVEELDAVVEVVRHEDSVEALLEFVGVSANNILELVRKRGALLVPAPVHERQQRERVPPRLQLLRQLEQLEHAVGRHADQFARLLIWVLN